MKLPHSVLIPLIAGIASLPVSLFATPVVVGNFNTATQQTSPTSGSILGYSSGMNIYDSYANPDSDVEPTTYLPSALVFGNSGPLIPGNQVSLAVSPSVDFVSGPGYSAFAVGEANGSLESGWGYFSAGFNLTSSNLSDVNSVLTVDVTGGVDDSFHGSVQVDTNRYLDQLLFSEQSYNDLTSAMAGQMINVSLASGFQPGTNNTYSLYDLALGNVFGGAFGPGDSSFVIAAGLLQAGHSYRVVASSQAVVAIVPGDLYSTYTFVDFTVGVPEAGATWLLLGSGMTLLFGVRRRFRR